MKRKRHSSNTTKKLNIQKKKRIPITVLPDRAYADRISRIVKQLLVRRGYQHIIRMIPDKEGLSVNLDLIMAETDTGIPFTCFIVPIHPQTRKSSIGKKDVEALVERYTGQRHVMLVVDSISKDAIGCLRLDPCIYWECIPHRLCSFDLMSHMSVPRYTVLSAEETVAHEKKFMTQRSKFPKMIARVDAVAQFMDFRPGQLLRVERLSGGTYYRYVINAQEHI